MGEEPLLLSGIVTDQSGRPAADVSVALSSAPVPMPDIAALTGEDGRFSFGVPVAGSYQVEAYGETGHAVETVELGQGARAEVRLVLQPPEAVRSDG